MVAFPVVLASRHPSELELITSYLIPRITSDDRSYNFIHHADVYTADPICLTGKFLPARAGDGEKAWYFFSPLRTKNVRGQRKARTVQSGAGCWHSEAGAKAVLDDRDRRVGHRQFFSFVKKEDGKRVRTGWLMVELGLDREQKENLPCELVLCKIYFTPRTPSSPRAKNSPAVVESGHKRKAADEINSDAAPPVQRRCRCLPEAAASHSQTADAAEEHSTQGESNERSENSTVISADAVEEEVTQGGSKEIPEKEPMAETIDIVDVEEVVTQGGSKELSGKDPMAETIDIVDVEEDTQGQSKELPEKGSIAETADAVEEDDTHRGRSNELFDKRSMADEPDTPQGDEAGYIHRDIMLMQLFDDGEHHPVTLPEALSEYCEAIAASVQRRQARLTPRSPTSRSLQKTSPSSLALARRTAARS